MTGKIAVVTGAGSGIGRATAIALARSGARVVVDYRSDETGAQETLTAMRAAGGGGWTHRADVSDAAAVHGLFHAVLERERRLDILVNNAGDPVAAKRLEEWSPEELDQALANNLRSVFLCAQAVLEPMKQQRAGRIINVSSIGASAGGSAWTLPYAAAKGGVETFTRGLARVAGEHGITVNCVSPGSIRTRLQERFASPEYIARMAADTAVGRTGAPEEVAAAVVFLASDAASFITGQIVRVDGGRRA